MNGVLPVPSPYVLRRPLILAVLFYALCLGVARLWLGAPGPPAGDPSRLANGGVARLRGKLCGEPEQRGERYRLTLAATLMNGDRPVQGRVLVLGDGSFPAAHRGDEMEVRGMLRRPPAATVPGGFDYAGALAERDIYSLCEAFPGQTRVLRAASPWSPLRWAGLMRAKGLASFQEQLMPQASALLAGLCLGIKPAGDAGMDEDFRASGTTHLLVASGSNVGFVMAFWLLVGRWVFFLPRQALWLSSVAAAFLYAGLAGGDPPVLRASLMAALAVTGYLLARRDRLEHAVFFSAGLLLLLRPRALFEASFQMSYAATLGVVMGAPMFESVSRLVRAERFWLKAPARLGRGVIRLLGVSLSAQLALAPFLIHYFHRVSWAGLLANMLAVPWSGFCMMQGAGLALLDGFCPGSEPALLWSQLTEKSVLGLWGLAHCFARLPGAEARFSWTMAPVAILTVLVLAVFVVSASRGRLWRWGVATAVLCLPALALTIPPRLSGKFTLAFLDVGNGAALVARSPNGAVTLVDVGDEESARHDLIPYLRHCGARRIDKIILTHADPSHAGGFRLLLREFPVGALFCGDDVWNDPEFDQSKEDLSAGRVARRTLNRGDEWLADGVRWRVLAPRGGEPADPDARCLVLWVRHGEQTVLLTGDLLPEQQKTLVEELPANPTVVQWPHHGALRPHGDFIDRLTPRWFVLSGKLSGPWAKAQALRRPLWVTGRDGTLLWESDGASSTLSAPCRPELLVEG